MERRNIYGSLANGLIMILSHGNLGRTFATIALFNFLTSQKNEKSKNLIPKNFKYDSDDEVESEEEEVDL